MFRRGSLLACLVVCLSLISRPADAASGCPRAAIFTLPGVTWSMVQEIRPPNLLRILEEGAAGSMSVRTNSARTSYASGFATLGAGTRTDGGRLAGGVAEDGRPYRLPDGEAEYLRADVRPTGALEIIRSAAEADYVAEPHALAEGVPGPVVTIGNGDPGLDPPIPRGYGRWVLLSGLRSDGTVEAAATGTELLTPEAEAPFGVVTDPGSLASAVDEAFLLECPTVIVDQGDLLRIDRWARSMGTEPDPDQMERALLAADAALGDLDDRLDPDRDLLLVVSPTSPWWDDQVHLGVAVAKGPGFEPGAALVSASTRQDGIVTLPDVAPTVVKHLGADRPASMLGRSFVTTDGPADPVAAAIRLDDESVFAHALQGDISTAFVIAQVVLYAVAFLFLTRRRPFVYRETETASRWLEAGALAVVAFPFVSYLQSPIPGHELGTLGFLGVLLALDALVVAVVMRTLTRPLERLLAIVGATIFLLIADLAVGTNLQLNAVWGNDPIVAGRFTGLGNIAFTILGTSSLLTGALLVHRWPDNNKVLTAVIALFAVTVVVDGAPGLGSDVGGVLALVPALGITTLLLVGKKPNLRWLLLSGVAAILVLGLFLALDLSRPSAERTHLGRLYETVTEQGVGAFTDAVDRKVTTNLRVFRSTIWTYLMPPALGVMGWLLLRPSGRWRRLAERYPRLRAGLIGGLLLGVLGFAVNDSGIVVPAMTMTYLVPLALLLHLTLERERAGLGS